MREVIDFVMALIFSGSFLFGGGYTIKQIHDYVKEECLEQVSQGLSSSEKLSNALTNEKLKY